MLIRIFFESHKLRIIIKKMEEMMSKIDEQNVAIANLQATANAISDKIDQLNNTNNDAQIEANTNAIIAVAEQLKAKL